MKIFRFVVFTAIALLSSCVSFRDGAFREITGAFIEQQTIKELIADKTTDDRIIKKFGNPKEIESSGKEEKWVYESLSGRVSTEQILIIKNYHCQFLLQKYTFIIENKLLIDVVNEPKTWHRKANNSAECFKAP